MELSTQNLLVELLVEELPPKALQKLGEAFAGALYQQLTTLALTTETSALSTFATPRRLAAHITLVRSKAASKAVSHKLMPTSVGLKDGMPSPALIKKLLTLGVSESSVDSIVPTLKTANDGKADILYFESMAEGASLEAGLQQALNESIAKLPIPKLMAYQLESNSELPGWDTVSFVRPAHSLIALHGSEIVNVTALGLKAGKDTQGHRFEAKNCPITIDSADAYETKLNDDGAVIVSFSERRAEIKRQLNHAAAQAGADLRVIEDDALLDEVTALVERPNVLLCQFEQEYLSVPQECLILTMKANQKYFPLIKADGKLSHQFLVVSNISPADTSKVIEGNERVVRPRLADAKFFFDQDRKQTLESRIPALAKVVYHNQLGSQAQRSERVRQITHCITQQWLGNLPNFSAEIKDEMEMLASKADQAAKLAKTDLLTDMVGEFPELQGIMGGYYARHEGLKDGVAIAIEDHYKPRFSGDQLPRNKTGTVLALADKLETLIGMFGIGNVPTGDRDPFALRRHALGLIRLLMEKQLPLDLSKLLRSSSDVFGNLIEDKESAIELLLQFIYERLGGLQRELGFSAQEVDAVLSLRPERLLEVPKRLAAVRAFSLLPEAAALASANKRVHNILKKNAAELDANTRPTKNLLEAAEEIAVYDKMKAMFPIAEELLANSDFSTQLTLAAGLREEVDAFFDKVMVMAENPVLRQQRLALLSGLQWHMNQVADISKLAT